MNSLQDYVNKKPILSKWAFLQEEKNTVRGLCENLHKLFKCYRKAVKLKILFHKKGHLDFIGKEGQDKSVNSWTKPERNTECAKILRIWYLRGKLPFGRGYIWKVQMYFFDL